MVIDTSAVLTILLRESDWQKVMRAILADPTRLMSTVSRLESVMVFEGRKSGRAEELEELIADLRIKVIPLDEIQLSSAIDAFCRYGKGRHPARLNLGDCCAYGLAKALDEPLLFKGDDFSLADVHQASKG